MMQIGQRIRELRQAQNLSQRDIERRTGLLCCYSSRVENGRTVPSVETLEKYASALEVPLYKLFYDGAEPIQKPIPTKTKENSMWGTHGREHRELRRIAKSLSRMDDRDRQLFLYMASKMAFRNEK
jgi:transcriptional regulator with XRE-family HTH domain